MYRELNSNTQIDHTFSANLDLRLTPYPNSDNRPSSVLTNHQSDSVLRSGSTQAFRRIRLELAIPLPISEVVLAASLRLRLRPHIDEWRVLARKSEGVQRWAAEERRGAAP